MNKSARDPVGMVGFMALVVVLGFFICSFSLQKGLERDQVYDDCVAGHYGGARYQQLYHGGCQRRSFPSI